jgi:hypothetical protein
MLSNKALGAAPAAEPVFVESVFSTYLYTGNGSSQTITNNIDLSVEGGLVWIKSRTVARNHRLTDTVRGATKIIMSNTSDAESTESGGVTGFNNNGFNVGSGTAYNSSNENYASWTFRKAKKFFDVVTYTGNQTARTISHNLGSVPGFIITKQYSGTGGDWCCYHRSLGASKGIFLNDTGGESSSSTFWNATSPTSTTFSLGTATDTNKTGETYVAYLFAHDAGGFGLSGSDNVISCGSYTGNGSTTGPTVTLGYEPQWLLVKRTDSAYGWLLADVMRTMDFTNYKYLVANDSGAEGNWGAAAFKPLATGFQLGTAEVDLNANGGTYIYIAIRRGPMKTPTTGTSVFEPVAYSGTSANDRIITASITPDLVTWANRDSTGDRYEYDRLRGSGTWLKPNTTGAEGADGTTYGVQFNKVQTGYQQGTADGGFLNSSSNYVNWLFRRAPGFFDVVCYTGNGSTQNVSHNLGVAPELIITKSRNTSGTDWWVYAAPLTTPQDKYLRLQSTDGESTASGLWGSSLPTSTTFGLGNFAPNSNTYTFVAYLFASVTGVSKVGSYTGNGSNQTINCGFTAGARFILIKRTDDTGDWYVYDSARGIVSGNDPQLKLNSTAAEATGYDAVDPDNSGFIVNNDATNFPINVNNATYIYLAIA